MQAVKIWAILTVVAAAIVLAASPAAFALNEFHFKSTHNLQVGSNPQVTIEGLNGDVSYIGGEGTEATVEVLTTIESRDSAEAEAIKEELTIVVAAEEGFLDVRMDDTRDFYKWLRREYSQRHQVIVEFRVHGPRGAEVIATSVSGAATVESVEGPAEVESVSGDVFVSDVERKVRATSTSGSVEVRGAQAVVIAHSVSGDVVVSGCGGDLDIESTSGSVRASDVGGAANAGTVSGDVELRGVARDVNAESVSGSIWIEQEQGGTRASSISGDITVLSGGQADISVETTSGTIEMAIEPSGFGEVILEGNDIDLNVPVDTSRQTQRRVVGRLGSGTAILRANTSSGSITISQR